MTTYTHTELNQEVRSIAGYYSPQKEVRFKYQGREVLYILGQANIEASCCASGCWQYALVPGYIVRWQSGKSDSGQPVSEVESISDDQARQNIARQIKETECVSSVEFW